MFPLPEGADVAVERRGDLVRRPCVHGSMIGASLPLRPRRRMDQPVYLDPASREAVSLSVMNLHAKQEVRLCR